MSDPSLDARLRDLERLAAAGDAAAGERLARERVRAGLLAPPVRSLLEYVGPRPDLAKLPPRWDEYVNVAQRVQKPAASIRDSVRLRNRVALRVTCGGVPPRIARALLVILDDELRFDDEPARRALVARWVVGLSAWGVEALLRGLAAMLRAAPVTHREPELAAFDAWLADPTPARGDAFDAAARALVPDFSPYYNFAPTGNTDALDEAMAEWKRAAPFDVALVGVADVRRAADAVQQRNAAEAAVRDFALARPADIERAIGASLARWASAPGARVEAPPPE